ncbi:MAG: phage tail protein [Bacteroidia bacterium]
MADYYPPPSFYFTLSIPGVTGSVDAQFKEVSGISAHVETEDIAMGGENRFKYKAPSRTSYENLVLKRGLVTTGSTLALWFAASMQGGLITEIVTMDVLVSLLGPTGAPLMSWTFIGAWPVKWDVSGFDSMENKIALETLELSYNYFVAMPGTPAV